MSTKATHCTSTVDDTYCIHKQRHVCTFGNSIFLGSRAINLKCLTRAVAVTSQYMTQLLAPLHFHIQYLAVSSFCYAKCYARNHATRHHTIQPSITITQYYDTDQTSVIKDDYAWMLFTHKSKSEIAFLQLSRGDYAYMFTLAAWSVYKVKNK